MEIKVTLKIGNGEKLHPGWAEKIIKDEGKPWQKVYYSRTHLACSCPNAQNGAALKLVSLVSEGWEKSTCKN